MNIDDQVKINVVKDAALNAKINGQIGLHIDDPLQTNINVTEPLQIMFDEMLTVPLKMDIPVRINTAFMVQDTLDLSFEIPLDLMLTEKEMPLRNLTIPFNQKLMIRDSLAVDFTIPLDTRIKTNFDKFFNIGFPVLGEVPVKIKIPISQELQVQDTITLDAYGYQVPLRTTISFNQRVPINQTLKIDGNIIVPVDQTVSLPVKKVINAPVLKNFKAAVVAENKNLNASFNTPMSINASFSEPMEVKMEPLSIKPENISIKIRP
jgi:hypothetical protein